MNTLYLAEGGSTFEGMLWMGGIVGIFFAVKWGLGILKEKAGDNGAMKQALDIIVLATQRGKDKGLETLAAAQSPNSPGGVSVTAEEKSKIRQDILETVLSELKGPALEWVNGVGANWVKAKIGMVLDDMLSKVGISLRSNIVAPPPTQAPANGGAA